MIRLIPIKPKARAIQFTRFAAAAQQGMEDAAKDAVKDFKQATADWAHDVTFGYRAFGAGYEVGPTGGATDIFGYQDLGTRAHRIVARRKKLLRFTVNGRVVFTKSVNHPGNKPRSFSKRIAAKYKAQLHRYIERRIREAM